MTTQPFCDEVAHLVQRGRSGASTKVDPCKRTLPQLGIWDRRYRGVIDRRVFCEGIFQAAPHDLVAGRDDDVVDPAQHPQTPFVVDVASVTGDESFGHQSPICFDARKLDKGNLVINAELGGTVPMWDWIGDEAATTFSY